MSEKRMVDYFDQLRPTQRQFIFWCINRKKVPECQIQPGLFPFVPAQQAVEALQDRFDDENFYGAGGTNYKLDDKAADEQICHARYIRHLISVLSDGVDLKRYKDQADVIDPRDSTVLQLDAKKIRLLAKRRFATYFSMDSIHLPYCNFSTPVEFLQRTPKSWLITANAKYLDRITTVLAENFR